MKRILVGVLIVLLVFMTFPLVGIDRSVTSGEYTVHRGETIHGGMFISSPGKVTIEEGARVDGAVFMGSGVLNLNGEIGGGLLSISGEVNTGPNAVVQGHATVTSVPFHPNPRTQINNDVTADISGWMGGPIGAPLVLVTLAFYIVFGSTIAAMIFSRRSVAGMSESDRAERRAATFTFGTLVIAAGALFLSRALGVEIDQVVFSLALLVPGAALFGIMLVRGPIESPMALAGSVLVIAGAITLFQGLTDHWTSWAYAWALVIPASIGLGRIIEGKWGRSRPTVSEGARLAVIGVGLFAAAWTFFELIVPATENSLLYLTIVLLIGAGLALIVSLGRRHGGQATGA